MFVCCLMPSHLRLLVREGTLSEPIDGIMHRLGTWYAYRFNRAVSEVDHFLSTLQRMRIAGASLNQIVRLTCTSREIVRKVVA